MTDDTIIKEDTQRAEIDCDEAQANRLQEELALLTKYSSDTVYRLRYETMRYDYVSPSVERLLGYKPDEIRQMNIRSLILETRLVGQMEQPVANFNALEQARKLGDVQNWQADYKMQTKSGKTIWVTDISYPWTENGSIVGSIGSLRDITARVQAEEAGKRELARQSQHDALTGLYSRHSFFNKLEEEVKRIRRTKEKLSLLLIDMDYFKNINNNYGHEIGDRVLKSVADIIRQSLRQTDTGSRVDGGQFAVILPDTPASGAYWVAERIRAAVAEETFALGDENHLFGCTVSIGLATTEAEELLDAGSIFKRADQRLYIAKHTGRNQVSTDELVDIH